MDFVSIEFYSFLIFLCVIYHFSSFQYRWAILLFGSWIFYFFNSNIWLLTALLLVVFNSYKIGLAIAKSIKDNRRRKLLFLGITIDILVLLLFKYHQFLPIQSFIPDRIIIVGLSYFTFQSIAYLVDIYYEKASIEKHLGYLALYFSFFPKILQGPIERSQALLPQLKNLFPINSKTVQSAFYLFSLGLIKKVVLADSLGVIVDSVYNHLDTSVGLINIIAIYLYSFQIYFDFSAYTDMAIGLGMLFNIQLTQNFNNPYFSISIGDFWRRWHISFSSWLMDYIFIPLQLSYRNLKIGSNIIAILATFLVCGVWHGIGLNFIIWGLLNGFFMIFSLITLKVRGRIKHQLKFLNSGFTDILRVVFTFHLVTIAWVFFRMTHCSDIYLLFKNVLIKINISGLKPFLSQYYSLLLLVILFLFIDLYKSKISNFFESLLSKPLIRYSFIYFITILDITLIVSSSDYSARFTYFSY